MFFLKVLLACVCVLPMWAQERAIVFKDSDLVDMIAGYSDEEKGEIYKDYALIEEMCFEGKETRTHAPRYIATAGAPGARKSTILEHILHEDPEFAQVVYTDPDQRSLKFMVHTYYGRSLTLDAVSKSTSYELLQRDAYNKWRAASNFIANSILEKALRGRYDIAHGTTMTGPFVDRLLTVIKDEGYHITLALCGCEDAVRFEAVEYRNSVQGFYQTTPEDVVNKGPLFPKRMPVYFKHADRLLIYWSDAFNEKERLAASLSNGKVQVVDQEAYERFVDKYERDRVRLNLEEKLDLPRWNVLISRQSNR